MKHTKKQTYIFCLLSLMTSIQMCTQNIDPDDIDNAIDDAQQVDFCVDVLSQGEAESVDRLTEVQVSTPIIYLKMLSDDPVTQGIIALLGALGLVVMMHQLYESVVQ